MKPSTSTTHYRKNRSLITQLVSATVLGFMSSLLISVIDWNWRGYDVVMHRLSSRYQDNLQALSQCNLSIAAAVTLGFQWCGLLLKKLINTVQLKMTQVLPHSLKHQSLSQGNALNTLLITIHRTLGVMTKTLNIILVKIACIVCAAWLFIFSALLGLLDGLVARYVRTMEGGRESTFLFHQLTAKLLKFPAIILLVYLITPLAIAITSVMLALIFFIVCFTLTSKLKKYV